MQLIEKKHFKYSEFFEKQPVECSLTYWKLKNNEVINMNTLLKNSRLKPVRLTDPHPV